MKKISFKELIKSLRLQTFLVILLVGIVPVSVFVGLYSSLYVNQNVKLMLRGGKKCTFMMKLTI